MKQIFILGILLSTIPCPLFGMAILKQVTREPKISLELCDQLNELVSNEMALLKNEYEALATNELQGLRYTLLQSKETIDQIILSPELLVIKERYSANIGQAIELADQIIHERSKPPVQKLVDQILPKQENGQLSRSLIIGGSIVASIVVLAAVSYAIYAWYAIKKEERMAAEASMVLSK